MNKLRMPSPEKSGFTVTLNRMGYMTSAPDAFSGRFIELARDLPCNLLEIGAAYGVATLPALRLGAVVVANDLDSRHLEILKARIEDSELLSRLTLSVGRFPNGLNFEPGLFDGILICRVMHFLKGDEIEAGLARCYEWLRPGGRLFVVAETPYLRNFEKFLPEFQRRLALNDPYPGYVDNPAQYSSSRSENLPEFIHFLTPEILQRAAIPCGFRIIECKTFARLDFPADIQLNGRESVGLIAEKPI